MSPLLATVVVASTLGSLHCAGMCGPFVVMACGSGESRPGGWLALVTYHTGRLATYLSLGTVAGLAGATLTLAGNSLGMVQAASVVAGVCMLIAGVAAVLRLSGVSLPHMAPPAVLVRPAHAVFRSTAQWRPPLRALAIGFASTWLPCGWLYAFVLAAAGAGSVPSALLVMVAFWIGTLPLLSLVGWGTNRVAAQWRTAVPWVSAAVMIIAGTQLLATRALADFRSLHGSVGGASTVNARVQNATSSRPPCCHAR